ncbi:MAG: SDR family NAD(P)-dependent oxidoreductase [Campylobacteraceae bacterium]
MNNYINDKTVIITGASSGLGRELALQLSRQNTTLILCARRVEKLELVKKECAKYTKKDIFVIELDLCDEESIEVAVKTIKGCVKKVDILINNAGFGYFKKFVDFDMKVAKNMFDTNLLGAMKFSQSFVKMMIEQKEGHIINVASQAAKAPLPELSIYSATKYAVVGFSNCLRLELKKYNVKVTTVNPGPIDTEFFDNANSSREFVDKAKAITLHVNTVARRIINAIGTNKREVNMPFILELTTKFYNLFPFFGDFVILKMFSNK